MRQSTDTELLSNYLEVHRLRRTLKRWQRIRWVFVLVVGGALWGVWVKTDWSLVAGHAGTLFDQALALFDKADAQIHSWLSSRV